MNTLNGKKRFVGVLFAMILFSGASIAAELDNLTRCIEVEDGTFVCRPHNTSSAQWIPMSNFKDMSHHCEKMGNNEYLCRFAELPTPPANTPPANTHPAVAPLDNTPAKVTDPKAAPTVATPPAHNEKTHGRVYVRPTPAFKGYTHNEQSGWFYVDISAEYYHIPKDNSYAEPLHGTGAGGRLGVGYRHRLGPGYASIGLQGGFHPVTDSSGDEDINITAIPVVLKAEYGFDITNNFLLRAGLSGGIIYGRTKNNGSGWDPLMGARIYGQFKITEAAGVYLGIGGDCAFETDGNILLPAAEIGLRLTF